MGKMPESPLGISFSCASFGHEKGPFIEIYAGRWNWSLVGLGCLIFGLLILTCSLKKRKEKLKFDRETG